MTFKKSNDKINWKQNPMFNNYHEANYDHIKEFAGIIEIDNKECLVTHRCKFRIQAIEEFKQIAKEYQGKFKFMYPIQG